MTNKPDTPRTDALGAGHAKPSLQFSDEEKYREAMSLARDLESELNAAREALRDVLGLIDSGYLIRDTSQDHKEGWHLKQLVPIRKLAEARKIVQQSERKT